MTKSSYKVNLLFYFQIIVVFVVLGLLFSKYMRSFVEGFNNPSTKVNSPCPSGYKQCPSGDCVLISDVHGGCPG